MEAMRPSKEQILGLNKGDTLIDKQGREWPVQSYVDEKLMSTSFGIVFAGIWLRTPDGANVYYLVAEGLAGGFNFIEGEEWGANIDLVNAHIVKAA